MRSPFFRTYFFTGFSLTKVPFDEPRSVSTKKEPLISKLKCRRETPTSARGISLVSPRPAMRDFPCSTT
jgi:hypothetical protein